MDPRSPYLHQNNHRYASQPHPQPHPRPHNNFHANTNIRASHHSSLPSGSPLPLRPLPPPPNQFHLPPAQPQLNPQNSSFPFNSNNINYNHHRTHPDVPNFSPSPRVLHQKSLDNELSRRLQDNFREIRVDSRESSRVLSDRWPTERPYSSSNLNQESYRRQLVNQTMPPMKIRQGLEGNSRLVEERNVIMVRQEEEFLMRRGDDNYPRRIQFGSISERSSRDSRTVSNQMNHGSSYDSLRNLQYDDRGCENQRRAHDRGVSADLRDSFIGTGSHERGADERMQISGKYENHRSREELERHTGKGSMEGSFEYNRTPRKQPQKRSALLRLQKPNNRNREEAKAQYYFDDSKSKSFRVKDQNLYPDRGMEQLVREGSPVELDVSFKSNSLVAKAIVTPSSSVAVSDSDSTPKNGKIRKVLFHNKDSSSSLIKSDEQTVKLENAISVANNTTSSDTSLIQAKEEGTTSVVGNLHKNSSVPASSGTKVLPGKSKMESSSKGMISKKDGTSVASTKTSSVKVTKKKKIVKRVVKKVLHHNLTSSSSQPTKKCDDTIIPDSVSHGLPDSSELENDVTIASASAVDSQLCSNGIMLVPENDKVEEICDLAASENGADACSSRLCVPNIKRKRSHSTSPMGSSSREVTQINENKLNANSADFMRAISDTNTDNKWLKEKFSPDVDDIEDVNKQHYEHEDSVSLENNKASSSLNMLLPSKSNAGIVISSMEKIEILEGQPSSYNTVLGHDTSHGLISSREGVTVSEYGVMVVGCKQHCTDQDGPSVENASIDEISNASCSRGNSKRFKPSDLEDATIQKVAKHPICSKDGVKTVSDSDNCRGLSEERICFSHGVAYIKQPSPERVSMSVDDVSASGSLNFMVSAGVNEEDTFNNKMSEENVESSQVNVLKSEVNESYLDPVNVVHRACWVDTTLRLSFKECIGCSGNADVQHCRDVFSGFPRESSIDVSEDFIASPKQKQRKLSGSQLKLSWTTKSDGNESPIIAASTSGGSQTVQEAGARESTMDPLSISDVPHSEKDNIASLANCSGGECYSTVASIREASDDDDPRGLHLCSTEEELAVPKVQSLNPPGLEVEQIVDGGTVLAGSTHQINSIYLESAEGEKMDVDAAEGKLFIDNGDGQCEVPSEIQSLRSDERLLAAHVENQSFHKVKNDSSSLSKYLSSPIDGNVVSVTNSSINVLELVPDTLLDTKYVDTLRDVTSTLDTQLSIDKVATDDEILGQSGFHGGSNMSPLTSDPLIPDISINSDHAAGNAHLFSGKTGTLPQMDMKNSTPTLNSSSGETLRKNQPNQALSRTLGSSSLAFAASRKVASSAYPSKRRTWHRTDNVSTSTPPGHKAVTTTVLKQKQLSKNVTKAQSSSYIRKGNSLVRKPIVLAAQSLGSDCSSDIGQLNSLGILDELKKNIGLDHRTLSAELPNVGTKTVSVSFETPRTPPLPTANITPNHSSGSLEIHMASPAADFVNNYATESSSAPVNAAESNDVIKFSEDAIKGSENQTREIGQINNFDGQNELNEGNLVPSNGNIITYVKPKSNQLIATSNPHVSVNNSINTSSTPSDGYYKRRKNQLIRTSLKSRVERMANLHDESVNSDEQDLPNCASSKNFTKTEFRKVVTKTRKPSKLSLVWTLHSSQLSNGNGNLLHRQKVWPHLFPWKRATYLKSFVPNAAASLISSSSSTMRKLLLLRKRDTVYTRSIHGFSLRKSKVLSVGGSSLKWSKSIERQSKKANEEATLAVAEAERKKREQSGASHFVSGTKNNSSRKLVHNMKLHRGERIFRIGSARYKMDSSRRILQRVSDDDSSYPAVRQTETDAKISYIPRRLVIGKDEYVRIGNGNQLVRDPKRRTRILASEKVRWSLHTARSRLARKRKYCQFFTRFGKCNKGDGKCHYIHDSSKIAVCTKFLKGLCFDEDCKLTHKVIPERMPDCSYFLQDICSNKNCPYRHVHVNPNASTCEGFLRGYCADGDECRKKHSYVCPAYEAMGSCPQGSKCKLHHPKNRSKGKKCKQLREKKNGQGRYFGSIYKNVFEPGTKVSGKRPLQDNGNSNLEGSNADYISLDFSDEAGETSNSLDEELYISDSNSIDLQLVGLEDQIKPIRIMNG